MTDLSREPDSDALAPLLGRTFILFAESWSSGYPGISRYRASLALRSNGGRPRADVRVSCVVERSGEETSQFETPVTYTGIGRDGTVRLTLGTALPWGPATVKLDPRSDTFDTAGGLSGFHETRTVAQPPDDHAAFDAAALGCLKAICRSWEPGFDIPPARVERTAWPPDRDTTGMTRSGFIEGAGTHFIVTDFHESRSAAPDRQVTRSVVREFAVRGLRPPASLVLTLVQRRVADGPWSSRVSLGEVHDEDYVPEAIRIFDEWFPSNFAR